MKKQEKKTYAKIIEELELVISKLNTANIPIEKSIQLYEEGINLTNEADKELTSVERNFDKIKKNKNASMLFYDKEEKIQVRLKVECTINHDNKITKESWLKTGHISRK